jgi:hypothetical protein
VVCRHARGSSRLRAHARHSSTDPCTGRTATCPSATIGSVDVNKRVLPTDPTPVEVQTDYLLTSRWRLQISAQKCTFSQTAPAVPKAVRVCASCGERMRRHDSVDAPISNVETTTTPTAARNPALTRLLCPTLSGPIKAVSKAHSQYPDTSRVVNNCFTATYWPQFLASGETSPPG